MWLYYQGYKDSIVTGIVKRIKIMFKITRYKVILFIADVSFLVSLESFNNSSGVDDVRAIYPYSENFISFYFL